MSTVNESIDKVLDDLSRPDLTDRALRQFPQCLQSAHSTESFRRDVKTVSIANPAIVSNIVQLTTTLDLPKLRGVRKVECFTAFTLGDGDVVIPSGLITPNTFVDLSDANSEFNYYGFGYAQSYVLLGNTLTIKGVDTTTLAISVTGQHWPSYALNELINEYETDSWLMLEFPQIVEAYLRLFVTRLAKDKDGMAIEMSSIQQLKLELLHAYPQEISK